jgi:hypothetical protein
MSVTAVVMADNFSGGIISTQSRSLFLHFQSVQLAQELGKRERQILCCGAI